VPEFRSKVPFDAPKVRCGIRVSNKCIGKRTYPYQISCAVQGGSRLEGARQVADVVFNSLIRNRPKVICRFAAIMVDAKVFKTRQHDVDSAQIARKETVRV